MIWDNFTIFRTNCSTLTTYIHAHVVGSRVDVVMLRDALAIFRSDDREKRSKTRLQFRAVNE